MNRRGAGLFAYLFWACVGLVAGLIFLGKFICKYWCGCG